MAGGKFKADRWGVLGLPAYVGCRQAEHALRPAGGWLIEGYGVTT